MENKCGLENKEGGSVGVGSVWTTRRAAPFDPGQLKGEKKLHSGQGGRFCWESDQCGGLEKKCVLDNKEGVSVGVRSVWRGGDGYPLYMENRASAGGRSLFLPALGVEVAAAAAVADGTEGRSPLGGDGKAGTMSAALALSSRNLSNSADGRWIYYK